MHLPDQEKSINRVLRAIESIRNQGMVIMVDEEDRENEGDIVFAAQHCTPEKINFMSRDARGLICLALEPQIVERLELPMMRDMGKSGCARETAFTVSIEAKTGVTTGISAHDRSHTIQVAVAEHSAPTDLVVPGHIFPLRGRSGGVLERAGHTEGSIDLAKLAGCSGAAVICEIMNEDGTMARMPDLRKLSERYQFPIVTIPDLINYRLMQESLVDIELKTKLKTPYGNFETALFKAKIDGSRHLAFIKGSDFSNKVVDVRVHMQRSLTDVLGGSNGGLSPRIAKGLQLLSEKDAAVFVYLTRIQSAEDFLQELEELRVDVELKDKHRPQAPIDQRHIGLGAQILRELGVRQMRILTSTNKSYIGLSGFGLEVVEHNSI